ncbi:MAG: PLDc_N domain-containing protein, partial [Actinobacteria bacterium]
MMVVQLALQISALVVLVKTPAERINIGGRKWLWALIIILGEIVGPIVFFVVGRKPVSAVDPLAAAPTADKTSAAVDALYGPQGGPQA